MAGLEEFLVHQIDPSGTIKEDVATPVSEVGNGYVQAEKSKRLQEYLTQAYWVKYFAEQGFPYSLELSQLMASVADVNLAGQPGSDKTAEIKREVAAHLAAVRIYLIDVEFTHEFKEVPAATDKRRISELEANRHAVDLAVNSSGRQEYAESLRTVIKDFTSGLARASIESLSPQERVRQEHIIKGNQDKFTTNLTHAGLRILIQDWISPKNPDLPLVNIASLGGVPLGLAPVKRAASPRFRVYRPK